MIERIREIIGSQNSCVLATTREDNPLCSLMFYTVNEDCSEIYFLSGMDTRKAENISANSTVSLLIDTRNQHRQEGYASASAVTVSGICELLEGNEFAETRSLFCKKHPYMKEFANKPDTGLFRVTPVSFLLLDGPFQAYYEAK